MNVDGSAFENRGEMRLYVYIIAEMLLKMKAMLEKEDFETLPDGESQ